MKSISGILSILGLVSVASAHGNWQGIVDNRLMGSGNFKNAAIIHNGFSLATSSGFTVEPEEALMIIPTIDDPSIVTPFEITVAGVRYTEITRTNTTIYGRNGDEGVIAVKTPGVLIFGVYGAGKLDAASATIQNVVNYLSKDGY